MGESAQPPPGDEKDEPLPSTTETSPRGAYPSETLPSPGARPSTTQKSPGHAAEPPPDTIREVPPSLPGIGTLIADRYRVERFIGSGGMAHVLAARHVELGHLVAVKVLDPTLAAESDQRERFSREARAMASLRSKHTVRVHDVGVLDSGAPFMVMEHLEGKDLAHVLAESGPLPLDEACLWMEQACEAVEEAHAKGIVHRDLKPQNLFLARSEGESSVRVLDFGIARSVGLGPNKLATITKAGDIIGTLAYMAPEQIRESKSVERSADIWSLGACLYRLVAGIRPFNATSEMGLVEAIFFDEPKPVRELRTGVPPILDALLARCLAKKPEDRYATVSDLRAALRSARLSLTEAPIVPEEQRPQTKTARLAVPTTSPPAAPPAAVPIAVPAAARVPEVPPEVPMERGMSVAVGIAVGLVALVLAVFGVVWLLRRH